MKHVLRPAVAVVEAAGLVAAVATDVAAVAAVDEAATVAAVVVAEAEAAAGSANTKKIFRVEKLWLFYPDSFSGKFVLHELDIGLVRNDARPVAHFQQTHDCVPTVLTVVDGAFVHIHPHETVGCPLVEIAGKLHGVSQSFLTMVERILDAVAQSVRDRTDQLRPKLATDRVPTQRKRQPGKLMPPLDRKSVV